jgi:hypothetical protein
MTNRTYAVLLLIGLGCLPLAAQAADERSPFEASLASTLATADTKKLSSGSNPTGYLLGLAYRMELYPGLGSRLHLGFMSFAGQEGSGLENKKRPQLHFGWDFMKDYGRLSVFGGLTATQWKQSVNASNPDFTGANRAEGLKLGARVGAEYAIGKGFSAQVTFDQTEFNRKFNPSWVGIGAVYRFKNE